MQKCQRVCKLRRMQSRAGVTGHRAVIGVKDGFKEAHGFQNGLFVFLALDIDSFKFAYS